MWSRQVKVGERERGRGVENNADNERVLSGRQGYILNLGSTGFEQGDIEL